MYRLQNSRIFCERERRTIFERKAGMKKRRGRMVRAGGRVRLARFTLEDHAYGASRLPKTTVLQSIECIFESVLSLRSWRYCKRTRNKVLAAEPTSERRSCEENRESFFEILWNTLRYFEILWNFWRQNFISHAPYRQLRRLSHKVYYISAGQTSLLQVQWEFYIWPCFYVAYYRKYVKLVDSVN